MSQFENPYYGGGGGGGFVSPGLGSPSGGSPSGGIRRAAAHSLRPVTIKQLLNATQAHSDAEWTIDDAEVGQVTLIAQVLTIQSQTTNCVYWLDDGTGRYEARHWVDSSNEDDSEKWGGIEEGTYIRVMGTLKAFGNKRYVNATHIRPIADPHEYYFHVTEAAYVQQVYQRGPPPRPSEAGQAGGSVNANSAYTNQSGSTAAVNDELAHLPPVQRKIMAFMLSQPSNADGIHVGAIARAVGGDANSISDALEKLMDNGQVYNTVDDTHFNPSI